MNREKLYILLGLLFPLWLVLAVSLPAGWIWQQGGWDSVGVFVKTSMFVLPLSVIVLDLATQRFRSTLPDFWA